MTESGDTVLSLTQSNNSFPIIEHMGMLIGDNWFAFIQCKTGLAMWELLRAYNQFAVKHELYKSL